jgi:hypothetical protein
MNGCQCLNALTSLPQLLNTEIVMCPLPSSVHHTLCDTLVVVHLLVQVCHYKVCMYIVYNIDLCYEGPYRTPHAATHRAVGCRGIDLKILLLLRALNPQNSMGG